jgi:hypothetical protein
MRDRRVRPGSRLRRCLLMPGYCLIDAYADITATIGFTEICVRLCFSIRFLALSLSSHLYSCKLVATAAALKSHIVLEYALCC